MTGQGVEARRFPKLGRKVGLYIALAAAGILALAIAVAWRQGLLHQQQSAFLHAGDATGIAAGMPVKFLGFTIGSVSGMRMKRGEVEVELTLVSEHAAYVPQGSRARISREGFIGAAFIEIVPRRDGAAASLAPNEVLPYQRPLAPAEFAEDLKLRVDPVVAGMRQTVDWLNSPEGDVRQAIATTREMFKAVRKSQEQLGVFMEHANATAATVRRTTVTMGETVERFAKTGSRVVEEELPRIGTSTTTTMREVAGAAQELHRTMALLNERLDVTSRKANAALDDARGIASDAGEITQAVRRSWPFNRVMETPRTRALPVDINDSPLPWPDAPAAPAEGAKP